MRDDVWRGVSISLAWEGAEHVSADGTRLWGVARTTSSAAVLGEGGWHWARTGPREAAWTRDPEARNLEAPGDASCGALAMPSCAARRMVRGRIMSLHGTRTRPQMGTRGWRDAQ